ncbi:hypothetical protein [Synechococcus sp. UW179A]|uniref:hypothetical protein n=1 Tax=Synechococcus sp. UW179A TaxID=2575510 RepID=UPI0010BEE8E9|nr:hypothetical protein [Synechococcus sp. UW179A]
MSGGPKVGSYRTNKYGVLEYIETTIKTRKKLEVIDKLDRIYKAHNHGYLDLAEDTTHVRVRIDRVEPAGLWSVSLGTHLINIGPDLAGERFDEIIAVSPGLSVYTNRHGMQRPGSSPLYVQELIIEED